MIKFVYTKNNAIKIKRTLPDSNSPEQVKIYLEEITAIMIFLEVYKLNSFLKTVYCCHMWAGDDQSSLACFNRVQNQNHFLP